MKFIKYTFSLVLLSLLVSCGGDEGDDPVITPTPPPVVVPPVVESPEKAVLVSPLNNEECNTGVSVNATMSLVEFKWNKSDNTTLYQLHILNLNTNSEQSIGATETELEFEINKNTPFKWWVISKSTDTNETAKSDEWKFYNSGDAIISYAPFPAELVSPAMGLSLNVEKIALDWKGSDVDNDIIEYEVFFGTTNPPTEKIETTTNDILEDISVSPNNYYWRILTRDALGNTSTSEVFQFKVAD